MIEPYNYNDEPSGRTDTLIQALEKIERLEKQLDVAVEALELYASKKIEIKDKNGIMYTFENTSWSKAQEALEQIKELEK